MVGTGSYGMGGRERRTALASAAVALAVALVGSSAAAEEGRSFEWSPSGLGASGVFGAQGSLTQSLGAARTELYGAGAAGFWLDVNGMRAPWDPERTMRFSLYASLGGGSAGFQGVIGSEGAYGLRWSEQIGKVTPERGVSLTPDDEEGPANRGDLWHALVGRAGYSVHLATDERVETSLVEVPRLEVGYQILDGFAMEARAHAGLLLTGDFKAGEGSRPLGTSVGWGTRIVLQGKSGKIDAGFTRYEPVDGDDLGPLQMADARVCVFTSRTPGSSLGLCATGRMELGAIELPNGRVIDATAVHGGLLVGVGVH